MLLNNPASIERWHVDDRIIEGRRPMEMAYTLHRIVHGGENQRALESVLQIDMHNGALTPEGWERLYTRLRAMHVNSPRLLEASPYLREQARLFDRAGLDGDGWKDYGRWILERPTRAGRDHPIDEKTWQQAAGWGTPDTVARMGTNNDTHDKEDSQRAMRWTDTEEDPCPERDSLGYCNCKRTEHARRATHEY
jgi:hypothetical protein